MVWLFLTVFLESLRSLVVALLRSLSIEPKASVFPSDRISTERVPFLLQWRPLQQRDGRAPLLLVATHVAHVRQLRTTCPLERAPHGSNKPDQARPRQAARRPCGPTLLKLTCSSSATIASTSRLARSPRSFSMLRLCQPRAQDLPAQLREQPAQAPASPVDLNFLFCASRPRGICTLKRQAYWNQRFECSATDDPLAESSIGSRTPLSKEPGRPSRDLLGLLTLG